jgi:hypothetical protein
MASAGHAAFSDLVIKPLLGIAAFLLSPAESIEEIRNASSSAGRTCSGYALIIKERRAPNQCDRA